MKRLVEKDRHTVSEGWTPAGERAVLLSKDMEFCTQVVTVSRVAIAL